MSRTAWRVLQVLAVAAVLWFVGQELWLRWAEVSAVGAAVHPSWLLIAASAGAVLASYVVLIWTWQRTILAWGDKLRFGDAARIWFVSSLGKYIPGKIWSIGAMGVLAQRAGASPVAAIGSSLVVTVVNVIAGFAVAGIAGAGALDLGWKTWAVMAVLGAGLILAPWILPVAARAARTVLKRDVPEPKLPHSAVWIAAAGCTVAWCIYGMAFRVFHVALLTSQTGTLGGSTAAFTASYLAGFLFLPSPGGLGVREDALVRLLHQFGIASGGIAWFVALSSRLWLTVLEVVPGVLYLFAQPRAGTGAPPSATNETHRGS